MKQVRRPRGRVPRMLGRRAVRPGGLPEMGRAVAQHQVRRHPVGRADRVLQVRGVCWRGGDLAGVQVEKVLAGRQIMCVNLVRALLLAARSLKNPAAPLAPAPYNARRQSEWYWQCKEMDASGSCPSPSTSCAPEATLSPLAARTPGDTPKGFLTRQQALAKERRDRRVSEQRWRQQQAA